MEKIKIPITKVEQLDWLSNLHSNTVGRLTGTSIKAAVVSVCTNGTGELAGENN